MEHPNPSGQALQFLTTTSLPFRGGKDEEESRRIVRSHAIRDAIRRRRLGAFSNTKSPEHPVVPEVPSQSSLTTRFKLNTKPPRRRKTALEDHRPPPSQALERRPRRSSLVVGPAADVFDPFDTLAIKIGPRQRSLLEYQTRLKQGAFTLGLKEALFSHAYADPAWLHATLSLISLHRDLENKTSLSHECLFHRGEALRLVSERLVGAPEHVSDETVAAISYLTNFDTINGLYSSATIHLNGMIEILSGKDRPSYDFLPVNIDMLQKVLAWTDLSYASVWDFHPRFPLIAVSVCFGSLRTLVEFYRQTFVPPPDLRGAHDLVGEMATIFQSTREEPQRLDQPHIPAEEEQWLTRGLYMAEYSLLVVLDDSDPGDDAAVAVNRNSHIYGSCRLAAYLYLYVALRNLPIMARMNQILARRLKGILEDTKVDLLVTWENDQHLLLWILSVGAIAMYRTTEKGFFVGVLKRLAVQMELTNLEAFTDALKEVLWYSSFDIQKGIVRALWDIEPTSGLLLK